MTEQPVLFDAPPVANIKYIEVTKRPTIQWLLDHSSKAFRPMDNLSDKDFIKTWKAVGIAAYMFRRNIEPKGFVWNRHRHLIHQLGSPTQVDKVNSEFKKRGLHDQIGLDISLSD